MVVNQYREDLSWLGESRVFVYQKYNDTLDFRDAQIHVVNLMMRLRLQGYRCACSKVRGLTNTWTFFNVGGSTLSSTSVTTVYQHTTTRWVRCPLWWGGYTRCSRKCVSTRVRWRSTRCDARCTERRSSLVSTSTRTDECTTELIFKLGAQYSGSWWRGLILNQILKDDLKLDFWWVSTLQGDHFLTRSSNFV